MSLMDQGDGRLTLSNSGQMKIFLSILDADDTVEIVLARRIGIWKVTRRKKEFLFFYFSTYLHIEQEY